MKIHSSSLISVPAGYNNAKKNNDESRPINIIEKNNNSRSQESLTLFPAKNVDKSFKSKDFLQLTDNIQQLQDQPANARTARALNSYIQENIEPLKDQRSALITSIDFFV